MPLPKSLLLRLQTLAILCLLLIGVCFKLSIARQCGIKPQESYSRRIIGGRSAHHGEFPWVIVLNRKRTRLPFCSGSLLSPKWVLTAAHCFGTVSITRLQIEAGSSNLNEQPSHVSNIRKVFIPEEFDGSDPFNGFDLALVHLERPIFFNHPLGYINGICLPPENAIFTGPVTAVGWGCTRFDRPQTSRILQMLDEIIFPNRVCEKKFNTTLKMSTCAGVPSICGRGVCKGDSGGPIQQYVNGRYVVVGVLSYGTNGCIGVYTAISQYIHWLAEILRRNGGLW